MKDLDDDCTVRRRTSGAVGAAPLPSPQERASNSSRSTVHRLVEVLAVLDERRALTYAQLRETVPAYRTRYEALLDAGRTAEEALKGFYGCVADDLVHLRAAGVRIEEHGHVGEAKSLQLHGDWAMKPLHLAPMEVLALYLAVRSWGGPMRSGHAGGSSAAARSTEVIAGAGSGSAIPFAGLQEVAVATVGLTTASLTVLAEAVDAGRTITFDYRTVGAGPVERRWVDPWGLVRCWGRAYLVGHDRARQDVRVFRASRIDGDLRAVTAVEAADLRGPAFTGPPPGVALSTFVSEQLPARAAEVRVAPHATGRFAHDVAGDAQALAVPDDAGRAHFRVRFWDAEWFAGVLRQYGEDVEVVEPDDVRRLVEEGLAAVAEQVAALTAGPL